MNQHRLLVIDFGSKRAIKVGVGTGDPKLSGVA